MLVKRHDINFEMVALSKSRPLIISTYMMLFSYFYNLPALTYSARGSNELRFYDFAGIVVMIVYFQNFRLVNTIIRNIKVLNTMMYFLIWANITLLFTIAVSILYDKIYWAFQSILYIFHFWSFFIVTVFLIVIIQNTKHLTRIVYFCLICAILAFMIVILQNFGLIPFLWNASYDRNYQGFLSGTLGPNKIVLGMTCLIIFAFALGLLNDKRVKINAVILAITIGLSLITLIISGSRTTYVGLLVFLGYFFIKETKNFFASSILVLIVVSGITFINSDLLDKAYDVYQGRVENKITDPSKIADGNVEQLYDDLGAGRRELSVYYLNFLKENPHIIPFGLGFNNRLATMMSAHNTYLSLINEVGLVGTILYFRWLSSYLWIRMPHFPQMRMALKGLVVSMLVTLLFGEHLYIYRPLFGLLGLFLFITTLLLSPMYIFKTDEKE